MGAKIIRSFPLKKITSTAIGGPASYYAEVKTEEELLDALQYARSNKLNKFIIGDATNLIPSDDGFDGLVIRIRIEKFETNRNGVYSGAGNNLLQTIHKLNKLGLSGFEKMAGIPGTVGGAIYGCAGAYGQEICDRLTRVRFWDGQKFLWFNNKQCRFAYRGSVFKKRPNWVIVGAEFKVTKSNPKLLQKISKEIIKTRKNKYPPDLLCPGSFFKNILIDSVRPASVKKKFLTLIDESKINHGPIRTKTSNGVNKIPAAYLLEQVGAKGMRLGGIAVADYHANLIYNEGGGKSEDIKKLAQKLKTAVNKKFGIKLEEEVQYL